MGTLQLSLLPTHFGHLSGLGSEKGLCSVCLISPNTSCHSSDNTQTPRSDVVFHRLVLSQFKPPLLPLAHCSQVTWAEFLIPHNSKLVPSWGLVLPVTSAWIALLLIIPGPLLFAFQVSDWSVINSSHTTACPKGTQMHCCFKLCKHKCKA